MRYVRMPAYTFSELSPEAKENAKSQYFDGVGYPWAEDALESLKALAEHFGGTLQDYSIDFFGYSPSYANFSMPKLTEEEIAELVAALGNGSGECVLTGYCADEDAIDGVRQAYHKGERDIKQLMQEGFHTWLESCQRDCEYLYSDETFAETCEANNYLYTKDGDLINFVLA